MPRPSDEGSPVGAAEPASAAEPDALREVALLFLRLGFTAFGGPAAHIAMMRDEVVRRRRWVDEQRFLDLLGATNLIPGPNSTEMAIHLGYTRAGWRGLIAAGGLFILPAALIVLALAWAYVEYGSTPQAGWVLYGVKPVIIAIVLYALVGLTRTAVKGPLTGVLAGGALSLYLLNANEIAILFGGGIVAALVANRRRLISRIRALPALLLAPSAGAGIFELGSQVVPFSLGTLFFTFLKTGAVLYGSGYVLLAFLRADFVERLGWLTDRQLLDAIAIGQFTPGPVFTTATFVGYILGGLPGAALATLGIFLPSFLLVAASGPLIPRIRGSTWASGLLDGVNAVALGLMAAVMLELGRAALVDVLTVILGATALVALWHWRVNSAWLVLAGAVAGAIHGVVGPALGL